MLSLMIVFAYYNRLCFTRDVDHNHALFAAIMVVNIAVVFDGKTIG